MLPLQKHRGALGTRRLKVEIYLRRFGKTAIIDQQFQQDGLLLLSYCLKNNSGCNSAGVL